MLHFEEKGKFSMVSTHLYFNEYTKLYLKRRLRGGRVESQVKEQ